MGTVKLKIPQLSPKGLGYRVVEVDEALAKREMSKPNLSRNSGFRNASYYDEPKVVEVKKVEEPTLFEKPTNEVAEVLENKTEQPTEGVKPKKKRK